MQNQFQIPRRAGWWLLAVIAALLALNLATGSNYSAWHRPGGQPVVAPGD